MTFFVSLFLLKQAYSFSIKQLILKSFVKQCKEEVDHLIEKNIFKKTENGILYGIIHPEKDLYPNEIILFVGGRNSIKFNYQFCKHNFQISPMKMCFFQYEGYYQSGSKEFSHESYQNSIDEIYNLLSKDYTVNIVAYSLGTSGAYKINNENNICLIAPLDSLHKASYFLYPDRNEFNFENIIKERMYHPNVHIYFFVNDYLISMERIPTILKNVNHKITYVDGEHQHVFREKQSQTILGDYLKKIEKFHI